MKGLTEQLETAGDQPDLTPLIDCVFLLLLFFVVTAVFVEEANLFRIELPRAVHAELREVKDVTVLAISRSGQFSLGQDYVPDDRLWDRLSAENSERPIRTLIIKGDRQSPYEKVIMATDMARALNVTEITWAVEPK